MVSGRMPSSFTAGCAWLSCSVPAPCCGVTAALCQAPPRVRVSIAHGVLTFSRNCFASSTMLRKASSSNQHSFVVRQSSCTRLVTTKGSSAGPRLQAIMVHGVCGAGMLNWSLLGWHLSGVACKMCCSLTAPVQIAEKVAAHLQLHWHAAGQRTGNLQQKRTGAMLPMAMHKAQQCCAIIAQQCR